MHHKPTPLFYKNQSKLTMSKNTLSKESIAGMFQLNGSPVSVKPLGNGLINDTYSVTTENGSEYVLQKINTAIFRNPGLLQSNIRKITDHIRKVLASSGTEDLERRVLTPVLTLGGEEFVDLEENGAWRMTKLIAGSHTEENVTPEMARLTGKAFGDFHKYFALPDAPELEETIPDFHNIAFRIQQLKDAVAENPVNRLGEVQEIVDTLLARENEMLLANRLNADGQLPKRTAHCDTKLNNILFDKDGNILCVIDLDTTMPGFVMSDFGDFMRTAANTGLEDDSNLENVTIDMDIFKSFAKGYVESASFLTSVEKHTLPFGAKLLTYMQTVRFLTDYINGDTYYKTKYPEHNLVRTKAQLKLLAEIDGKFEEMEQFIDSL